MVAHDLLSASGALGGRGFPDHAAKAAPGLEVGPKRREVERERVPRSERSVPTSKAPSERIKCSDDL